ncbi:MAG TPA: OmpA family protein [Labilithrix sp.]|jgi:peptidoglycan-associated lipoprotein
MKLTTLLLAALVVAGCDAPGLTSKNVKSPTAKGPVGDTTTSSAALPQRPGPPVETSGLSVSDAIAKACGIPATSGASPSFEYDSASLGEDDRAMLGAIAKCLAEGALRGKNVVLIGRADPRGEDEYNMNLGSSRANSVNRYMVDLGVGKDRMQTTSRGELDASGKDEAGWARDRRVDIELAK